MTLEMCEANGELGWYTKRGKLKRRWFWSFAFDKALRWEAVGWINGMDFRLQKVMKGWIIWLALGWGVLMLLYLRCGGRRGNLKSFILQDVQVEWDLFVILRVWCKYPSNPRYKRELDRDLWNHPPKPFHHPRSRLFLDFSPDLIDAVYSWPGKHTKRETSLSSRRSLTKIPKNNPRRRTLN
jgi:hypothetical protein